LNIMIQILDPRPTEFDDQIAKIQAAKDAGKITIGLEVTIPDFAAQLDFNIDPQHSGGDSNTSCIEAVACGALGYALVKGDEFAFFTVRPDLDSFGAYVVAQWLLQCRESLLDDCSDRIHPSAFDRIEMVHKADCFQNAGTWQPRELFSEGYETSELAAIARCVSDFKMTVEDRVAAMEKWLEYGINPDGYAEAYERDRASVRQALESGDTEANVYACDFETATQWTLVDSVNIGGNDRTGFCYVYSTLRAATSIGYSKAPVVVAFNPEFPDRNLGQVAKFTICQYAPGYVDLKEVFSRLNDLEPGWGGSPTIGGSPQGVSSTLDPVLVCRVVQDCMIL
jgi:hypothetical protein